MQAHRTIGCRAFVDLHVNCGQGTTGVAWEWDRKASVPLDPLLAGQECRIKAGEIVSMMACILAPLNPGRWHLPRKAWFSHPTPVTLVRCGLNTFLHATRNGLDSCGALSVPLLLLVSSG